MKRSLAVLAALTFPAAATDGSQIMFQAIRDGNIAVVKAHSTTAAIEARDQRGATPLMHAAAFGNLETLRILLDAGADVNASNDFKATALLWAARNPDKARLLIERGANPNAQSKQGRTPLMIASMRPGGSAIVALLLAKGAEVNARDRFGVSALILAAKAGDVEIMRLLLAKGADLHAADFLARTPLFAASVSSRPDAVQLLIQAGADVNARDSRNLSPLFFALATEYPSIEIVRTLIGAGADVNVPDTNGDTPLDWAEKFSYPDIIAELKKAGAKQGVKYAAPKLPIGERPQPAVALERALKLLETTSATFFNGSGCVSCHTQNLVARTQPLAKAAGVSVNEAVAREQALQIRSQWIGLQEEFLQAIIPGGGANRLAENLLGLKAANCPPDSITDSAIVAIAESQDPEGGWGLSEVQHRPPIGQSPFAATTRIIRVLQDYAIPARKQEFVERVTRARAWLMQAKAVTTDDVAMRLSGLAYSGAPERDIKKAAGALLALQRPDGGWGGNPYMKSDAYATGGALVALIESKSLSSKDPQYRRGVAYLSTQFPDGSWHVRSRSIKFQPYFESGFPFGHDQWISTAATAWAAQAIGLSIQPTAVVATVY